MIIPSELNSFFKPNHFLNYPKIEIPQKFVDSRGAIMNIADGKFSDVAVIECKDGAVRANHIHQDDWHICYLVYGKMEYKWADSIEAKPKSIQINQGELFYTPPKVPHLMKFIEDSCFIAVAKLSRLQDKYEDDTKRLENFFSA